MNCRDRHDRGPKPARQKTSSGFSLVETIVATALLATALVSLAQLLAIGTTTNASARTATFTTILAQQKMEQLRALTWGFDAAGLPLSDVSTNTALAAESSSGGTGLQPSPADALRHDSAGYVDYLDTAGQVLGGGPSIPQGAVYVRRWSIQPLPADPQNTLVLQILVRHRSSERQSDQGDSGTSIMPNEARLVSVKTRKTL